MNNLSHVSSTGSKSLVIKIIKFMDLRNMSLLEAPRTSHELVRVINTQSTGQQQ